MTFWQQWLIGDELEKKNLVKRLPICDPTTIRSITKIEDDENLRYVMATLVNSYLADLEDTMKQRPGSIIP